MSKKPKPKTDRGAAPLMAAAHELIKAASKLAPDGDGETMLAYAFAIAIAECAWPAPIHLENIATLLGGVMHVTNAHWRDLHGIAPGQQIGRA
jgi:hypothetical protein